MPTDVLLLLPPETPITGIIGDKGSYRPFQTTAGTARADIVLVCEAHAANQVELHKSIPHFVTSPTHPSSHWFHEGERPTVADLDEVGFPGVQLHLTLPNVSTRDVRTDPWVLENVVVNPPDFTTWDDGPTAAQKAAAYFKKLADFLDTLTR